MSKDTELKELHAEVSEAEKAYEKALEANYRDGGATRKAALARLTAARHAAEVAGRAHEAKPHPRKARQACADCGEEGERIGHQGCQYPQDHE